MHGQTGWQNTCMGYFRRQWQTFCCLVWGTVSSILMPKVLELDVWQWNMGVMFGSCSVSEAPNPISLHGCIFLTYYLSVLLYLLDIPHFWCFRSVHTPLTSSTWWIIAKGSLEGDEIFWVSPHRRRLARKPKRLPFDCSSLFFFGP